MSIQIYEAQMFPYRINAKNSVLRHIIIKLSKVKDKEFWKQQKQLVTYKGTSKELSAYFSEETCRPRESEMIYSKIWKKNLSTKDTIPEMKPG